MYDILGQMTAYQELEQELKKASVPVSVSGCMDSQRVQLCMRAAENFGWTLYVCKDEKTAAEVSSDCRSFAPNTFVYPAKDLLFSSSDIQGNYITNERMNALRHLMEDAHGVLVATADCLMDQISAPDTMQKERLSLREGMVIHTENLAKLLARLGYERVPQVELAGQYAVRGGIVDIYPMTFEEPYRVEFFDDEVDTIRSFDPESQRSTGRTAELELYPASEQKRSRKASLLDYFDEHALIVLDEPLRIKERMETVETEFQESMTQRLEKGMKADEEKPSAVTDIFSASSVIEQLHSRRVLLLRGLDESVASFGAAKDIAFHVTAPGSYRDSFEFLLSDLRRWQKENYRITILTPSPTRVSRLAENLREYGIRAYCPDGTHTGFGTAGEVAADRNSTADRNAAAERNITSNSAESPDSAKTAKTEAAETKTADEPKISDEAAADSAQSILRPGTAEVIAGTLRRGFVYPEERYVLLTENDMFGVRTGRKKKHKEKVRGQRLSTLNELSVGDYVVHESHGIGIYRGLEHIEQDGNGKDYIKIEYADGGNLYLPATKLDLVQKFSGADGRKPKLNKLNGTEWTKTKQRVSHAVKDIAKELVQLYARRSQSEGFRCGPDTVWQKEFEELFPYEETDDQLSAIRAVKADMESRKIMDRLVCGDVGFGKTEIALRAAFKAVQEGRQVAYLVPTTILAQQHYNTFAERMRSFPVNVAMLSRFATAAENKKTVEGLKCGTVDIVIGTHRLLSKDVKFKNLGLLIIDEQQRFGVAHKEKIKQLKTDIDVLTLTATPIPRTLHMSLSGIRDLSLLEEPPIDRVPIQTYVMEYNDELVREAIRRETARGGQVYYVYNRVKDIEEKANKLRAMLPDINIAFAHGKMHEHELERVMMDFVSGKTDVLISTTIIETGLDIPNANTLIVDGAERMGLSQLYQIRGRVGRSNKTSYAFLMYRKDKLLSEDAEKRLKAIREFTEFGAGIKIAMRDLEIRGAGNVLGAEQSGQMEAVGYELYCKLLSHAVKLLKGTEEKADLFETTVDCDLDAYIPEQYIPNERQRLDIYKRIAAIASEEDELDMQDELLDRFGELPAPVLNLLKAARLKAEAHRAYATDLVIRKDSFRIEMYPEAEICVEKIPDLIVAEHGKLKFQRGKAPCFVYEDKRNPHANAQEMLKKAVTLMEALTKDTGHAAGKEAGRTEKNTV